MVIRLSQIDGKLPNLALMKLAAWHRERGDAVHFFSGAGAVERDICEPDYDRVYGSAIFEWSAGLVRQFRRVFANAIVGGSGTQETVTVEEVIGKEPFEKYDYAAAPDFTASIGYTQRGCRFTCGFCIIPQKEGRCRAVNTVAGVWRGEPWPKHLLLLDNDFFGAPGWEERIGEIRVGGFKVSFVQGINVRAITAPAAAALASIAYRDDGFRRRRLYTAWDDPGDETAFFRGVDLLEAAGVPPRHVMVYMLVGYDRHETWEGILYRFRRLVARGLMPYPMVFDRSRDDLRAFARWVITGLYRAVPFEEYDGRIRRGRSRVAGYQCGLFDEAVSRADSAS